MAGGRGDWRPVAAALANPHCRRVYAQIVLGEQPGGAGMGAARLERAVAVLLEAGLVREVDGRLEEIPGVFRELLASTQETSRRTGAERFLTGSGEIDRYPLREPDLRELLQYVVERTVDEGEVLSERELGERLSRFSPDTATLRRYLVEQELLERTRSGSEYARVTDD